MVTFKRILLRKEVSQAWKIDEILLHEGVKRRLEEEIAYTHAKEYAQRKEIEGKFRTRLLNCQIGERRL